jgi:ankyrin repeat protein
LHIAAITGSIDYIKVLLGGGVWPYQLNIIEYTLIYYATAAGIVQSLAFLLKEEGNIDIENFFRKPFLFIANYIIKKKTT